MNGQQVNVAGTLERSSANGPGERFVVWVQGCSIRCPGCWNPEMWSHRQNRLVGVDHLTTQILSTEGIEGITLTGGEPFEQSGPLLGLVEGVRAASLSVVAFTGYRLDQLAQREQLELLSQCDVLIAGRYDDGLHTERLPWRGSSNQTVHFLSDRYHRGSIPPETSFEVFLAPDGAMTLTGFPPSFVSG